MGILKAHKNIIKKSEIKSKNIINIADNICNNRIIICSQFKECNINNIKDLWNLELEPIKTFKAYLYGLYPISYLCNAFEYNKDIRYLEKAKEIILSYMEYIDNYGKVNMEFAISISSVNIVHFLHLSSGVLDLKDYEVEKIIGLLKENSIYLSDISNYIYSNHGLWQDIALLSISLIDSPIIDSNRLISIGMERICKQINKNFTEDFINIENSSFYHIYNLKLFQQIKDFIEENFELNELQKDYFKRLNTLQYEGRRVYESLIRQDKSLPYIGDTEKFKEKSLMYKDGNSIYKKTGLALLKGKDYYYTVKSGTFGLGHKHRDELSFTIFYKNIDVLIDCGKYNYEKSPVTTSIKSIYGHNLFCINDKKYPIISDENTIYLPKEETYKAGINSYFFTEKFDYIRLFNNFYKEARLNRDFILVKPNIILLVDSCDSFRENKYAQNFNIGSEFSVLSISKNNAKFIYDDMKMKLSINQYLDIDDIEINYGNQENYKGFSSKEFNVLLKNYNLGFIKNINKSDTVYVSTIEIHTDDKEEKRVLGVVSGNKYIELYYKNLDNIIQLKFNIETKEFKETLLFADKIVQMKNGIVLLYEDNIKVILNNYWDYYLCHIKLSDNILKKDYQKDNTFVYENIKESVFSMKVIMKKGDKKISENIKVCR